MSGGCFNGMSPKMHVKFGSVLKKMNIVDPLCATAFSKLPKPPTQTDDCILNPCNLTDFGIAL